MPTDEFLPTRRLIPFGSWCDVVDALLPFKAESSRNSTKGCIAQAPVWLRGLVQPHPGRGFAQLDYVSEEFFIAGVLADDLAVLEAYAGGDPYIPFAVANGLMPARGTKDTHPTERTIAKTMALATQYGAGIYTLSRKSGLPLNRTADLLD